MPKRKQRTNRDSGSKPRKSSRAAKAADVSDVARDATSKQLPPAAATLSALALRSLEYRELASPHGFKKSVDGTPGDVDVDISGEISFFPNQLAELGIACKFNPSPQPIEIKLAMSALFRFSEGMTQEQVVVWLNATGLLILYPYVREVVSSVSLRGAFGTVLLAPIPITRIREMLRFDAAIAAKPITPSAEPTESK